jgi:hypothetical protein
LIPLGVDAREPGRGIKLREKVSVKWVTSGKEKKQSTKKKKNIQKKNKRDNCIVFKRLY